MPQSFDVPLVRLTIAAAIVSALSIAPQAIGQTTTAAPQASAAAQPAARTTDSTTGPSATPHQSRFSRFRSAVSGAVGSVAAKTNISKETAARLAVTAATGGAAAALMDVNHSGLNPASAIAAAAASRAGANPTTTTSNRAELDALTYLSQVSQRAAAGDPASQHAVAALNTAMSAPNGPMMTLEHRATAGDPTAAQQIVLQEAAIVRANMFVKP